MTCLLTAFLLAQAGEPELPNILPADFSGFRALGPIRVSLHPDKTEVALEEPVLAEVRIEGPMSAKYPPTRAKLRPFSPETEDVFYLEPAPDGDRRDGDAWIFAYRLRPKRVGLLKLPLIRLVHLDERGPATAFAEEEIDLRVTPRPVAPAPASPLEAPDDFFRLAPIPARSWLDDCAEPYPGTWIMILFLPPLIVWRLEPRRTAAPCSAAAATALTELDRGLIEADVLADYLKRRFVWTCNEVTPRDVGDLLTRVGVHRRLRSRWQAFYQQADDVRFGGMPAAPSDPRALIHDLEADPCVVRYS